MVGASVALSGELLFPEGAGPFPAVVLAHGCEGNRNVEPVWGPFLRKAGYATFNVDSLRGRGLDEVCTQPAALSPLQRVSDISPSATEQARKNLRAQLEELLRRLDRE